MISNSFKAWGWNISIGMKYDKINAINNRDKSLKEHKQVEIKYKCGYEPWPVIRSSEL